MFKLFYAAAESKHTVEIGKQLPGRTLLWLHGVIWLWSDPPHPKQTIFQAPPPSGFGSTHGLVEAQVSIISPEDFLLIIFVTFWSLLLCIDNLIVKQSTTLHNIK